MRELRTSARYRRDVRRLMRRGKDPEKLRYVISKVVSGEPMEQSYRVHQLVGNWYPRWECHIEYNWLLVWEDDGDTIVLRGTGTHTDIFG